MNRRGYLAAVGALGATATAGCIIGQSSSGPEGTVLSEPEDQFGDSSDLQYPAWGQPFPAFELPAIPGDSTIDTGEIDRIILSTAFFSSCPTECAILLNHFAGIQVELSERGLGESVYVLPVTFDPQRDTPERLREHATIVGADLDAGNWYYLRPPDEERAESVVLDQLGVAYDRIDDSNRLDGYDFRHIVVTWLVNPDGIVERAYLGENIDRTRVIEDIEEVAGAYDLDGS